MTDREELIARLTKWCAAAKPGWTFPLELADAKILTLPFKREERMSEHSPLGASGADRWMQCHGSVGLLEKLGMPESDEEDYQIVGTAMHAAAAHALTEGLEGWELTGTEHNGVTMTSDLVVPIDVYLQHVRPLMAACDTYGVEFKISSPVHPLFFGTADFWGVAPGFTKPDKMALHVIDLKGGIGVMVEVEHNVQVMYYAFGVIDTLERQRSYVIDDDMEVVLGIVQPRAFHPDGPVRQWPTTVGYIKQWVHETLVPHMLATAYDNSLDAGPWCRFCPAKLVCPVLTNLFRAACTASPDVAGELTDDQLGFNYRYADPVKMFVKALEKEAMRRLNAGRPLPWGDGKHLKLVYMKANRTWKEGARELAIHRYGAAALEEPLNVIVPDPVSLLATWPKLIDHVKSPAQMEKVPEAAEWVKSFAYQPKGALTVAPPHDPRPAIEVSRLSEKFAGALDVSEMLQQSVDALAHPAP